MANPKVSVVLLTSDVKANTQTMSHAGGRLFRVKKCLDAQTFRDFEVIIASEKGIVNAMNKALQRARGEIFVRIDDDVELPAQWLEELIKPFSDSKIAGVTGPTYVPEERRNNRDSIRFAENPGRFLKWLYDNGEIKPAGIRKCGCVSYDSNFKERIVYCHSDYEPDHLEGTNWAVRTNLIHKVGGFDPKFDGVSEWFDDDLVFKIKKLGYKLQYNSKAHMFHLLDKGEHYRERFEGLGRIKNFLRFHWRHGRHRFFNIKFYIYLTVWMGYFACKIFRR